MILTDFTPAEQTTITITTCILMVIVVIAFIVWLFVCGKEKQKLDIEKTKLEIKKLKQDIEMNEQFIKEMTKKEEIKE